MQIKFKSISIQNFKGIRNLDVSFNDAKTIIKGQNASGKTTIVDAVAWLLFDKDSEGNSKFEIRPLDASGEKIHHVEIIVTGIVDVDGTEYELRKVQKEKWTKKRGQETQEFSGNQNNFEINGFPKSDKEYKAFIADIVDEQLFKLLTSPTAFSALKWQDQRSILMRFVEDVPADEIEAAIDDFNLIAGDLAVASVDDCKKKYTKAKRELTDKQKTIPVRIDELERSKVLIDEKFFSEKVTTLQAQIDTAESDLRENPLESADQLNEQIVLIGKKQIALNEDADRDRKSKWLEANTKRSELVNKLSIRQRELNERSLEVETQLEKKHNAKLKYDALAEDFAKVKAETFDESKNVCFYCGQKLPQEDIEKNKKAFLKSQQDRKSEINAMAIKCRDIMRDAQEKADSAEAGIPEIKSAIRELEKQIDEQESVIKIYETPVDATGTDAYKKLNEELETVKKKIEDRAKEEAKRQEQLLRIKGLKDELRISQDALASVKVNENIDARINELRIELKSVSQKLADSDRLIFVLENYVKFLAQRINDRFEGLDFRLFEIQVNGGIKETCEVSYNGVPYNSLNSGHRIVAGLEIIKTLQGLYDVYAPVFVDNSETLNDFNMPDMECQVVSLKVTEDSTLTIS